MPVPRFARAAVALAVGLCTLVVAAPVARAASTDIVGSTVGTPVTVYSTVAKDSDGELVHEGNRVPDIVAVDSTHLVVGWRAGVADTGTDPDPAPTDQGSIMYAYSSDAGATWTTGTLAAADSTYRYHYVMFLNSGGTLYAFLGRITIADDRDSSTGEVDGFPVEMIAKKSTDNGHTWSSFAITVNVAANVRGVVVAGKPLLYNGVWLLPYWQGSGTDTRAGVLRSTDLATWTPGALAANPTNVEVEEPQVVVDQSDSSKLLMVTRTLNLSGGSTSAEKDAYYRANAGYAATATSTDGGLTWSALTLNTAIPNYYVKGFFAKDSAGQYLSIYNTLAGPFTGAAEDRPDQYREVLYYQVKRPGAPWGPGRLFADGARETAKAARGWDVYASATEYAAGKFFVVWEHNQTNIKVAKLDISTAFTGVNQTSWSSSSIDGVTWTSAAGTGTAAVNSSSQLHLANADGTTSGVTHAYGPSGGFVATIKGRVTDYSTLDTATGVGTSLALKVATGTYRLMLAIQADGVYSFVSGTSGWSRVYAITNDTTTTHTWKVVADASGNATLYMDAAETGVTWTLATKTTESARVAVWTSGTSTDSADAVVDLVDVTDNVASSTWSAAGAWTLTSAGGTAEVTGGALHLINSNATVTKASTDLDAIKGCDFTVDFRGQVDDDSALDPTTGIGVSLATKVVNGARRLMLTIQKSGVYTIKKGATDWEKVYSLDTAADLATWKVTVNSAGVAHLYRNGTDTGATWVVQDSREDPKVMHWVEGTAGGNTAEAHVYWTRVTCTLN
jgi:hypothetical protein